MYKYRVTPEQLYKNGLYNNIPAAPEYEVKSRIIKILSSDENSKRKIPNQMAKSND